MGWQGKPTGGRSTVALRCDRYQAALERIAGRCDETTTRCTICRAQGDVRAVLIGTKDHPAPALVHESWCPVGIAQTALTS